ncbi:GAF domain-containing DNA-binding protein [Luteolibacter luteus]|uniref:HTH LytTR-type domain-containing protein n=1 Tax=Luteolibacter luteus TaxID=2728835 RepID=A0A858RKJ4_9BACT|nr:LytTR family transcriptional regulator DNA-binding domain-containing protein [Luteolibacter luteus]QJE96553.1 hypothetical protein HHL09_12425 [Luteolibacter luteus]
MPGSARPRDANRSLWQDLALVAACHPAEAAVNQALACMGRAHDVDRVWIVRYNDELTHLWNTHEWSRDGVSSHVEDLQGASVDFIHWLHGKLLDGETVPVFDIEELPRQARGFQAELRRQKIRSSINAPLFHEGKLRGIFGYDMVRRLGKWTKPRIDFVTQAATYLAGLLYGSRGGAAASTSPVHPSPRTIHIHSGGEVVAVNRDDLILIEADGDYTHLHFTNRHPYTELRSLKSWEALLPEAEFLRISQRHMIHHSCIQRLDRSSASGWRLHLHGWPEPLAVGRTYRHRVRQHLGF